MFGAGRALVVGADRAALEDVGAAATPEWCGLLEQPAVNRQNNALHRSIGLMPRRLTARDRRRPPDRIRRR